MKCKSLLLAIALFALAASARASDFDGTWKGTVQRPGGGDSIEMVYKLKVEGETLTGTIDGPFGQIAIEDGKATGNEINFNTSFNDNKIPHNGKLADGKLTISVESPRGKREYTLTRADESAAAAKPQAAAGVADKVTGKWKGNFKSPSGDDVDLVFNLKAEGDKLTGNVEGPGGTLDLEDGKIEGNEISFNTTVNDAKISHKGTAGGDEITLKCNGFGTDWELVIKRDTGK